MIRDLNDNEDKNIGGNENDDDNVNLFTTMTIDMTITGQLRRTKLLTKCFRNCNLRLIATLLVTRVHYVPLYRDI